MPLTGRIGHFAIVEKLGEGGMGEVYLAVDENLSRKVALKMLADHLAADADFLRRFRAEAETIASLAHPNIVQIYSIDEFEKKLFFSMEYVDGASLAARVKPAGVSLEELRAIAQPLLSALAGTHEAGIIHRDLKPTNVRFNSKGVLKVLDFGLAKREVGSESTLAAASVAMTKTGTLLGTIPYMSPEQAVGSRVDHTTDLFSVGVILYELLAGSRPFVGDTLVEVLAAIIRDQPASLATLRPDLPPRVSAVVERCLEKDRTARYASAAEVWKDLESDGGPVAARGSRIRSRTSALEPIGEPHEISAEAFYARGRHYLKECRRRSFRFARQMFSRAIVVDASFARAYAGIADCCCFLFMYFEPQSRRLVEADALSKRALEIEPNLAEGYCARGFSLSLAKQNQEAEAAFQTAIDLDERLFDSRYLFGRALFAQGEFGRAAEQFQTAVEIDPTEYQVRLFLAQTLKAMGREGEANIAYRSTLDVVNRHVALNPDDGRALYLGAIAYGHLGEKEKSVEWADLAVEMDPDSPLVLYNAACVLAQTGDTERALDYLEQAVAGGMRQQEWIDADPDLEPLRGSDRFWALMKAVEEGL